MTRILSTVLLCFLAYSIAGAQPEAGQKGLTVRSTPQGALVTLSGDMTVSGVTPALFRQILVGEYRLQISRFGYETYSTDLILDPSRPMEVAVELSAKTGLKAASRSLFIPGWGQRYYDKNFKGTLFTILAAGSLVAYLLADDSFDDKFDRYQARLREYDSIAGGGSMAALRQAQLALDEAQDEAYDAENARRATIGIAVGIWTINLLDALFLSPDNGSDISIKGLNIRPTADVQNINLTFSVGF